MSTTSSVEEYTKTADYLYQSFTKLRQEESMKIEVTDDDGLPSILIVSPIRLWTALRWCSLSVGDFRELISEVAAQCSSPHVALALFLYQSKTGDLNAKTFSVEQWNAIVAKNEKKRKGGKKAFFAAAKLSDEEEDISRCGGTDRFEAHNFTSKRKRRNSTSSTTTSPGSPNNNGTTQQAWQELDNDKAAIGIKEATSLDLSSLSTAGGGSAGSGLSGSFAIFGSVIAVFQGVRVWSTSIEFPAIYDKFFGPLFSFASIDITGAFPSVPTIGTPLIQVAAGLTVLGLVMYLMFEDERIFGSTLSQYVWRRDSIATGFESHNALLQKLPTDLLETQVDPRVSDGSDSLPVLPLRIAIQLDKSSTDQTITIDGIEGCSGEGLTVKKLDDSLEYVDDQGHRRELRTIGVRCARHERRLTALDQTNIWPFHLRPACCVALDGGTPCGVSTGKVYSCGKQYLGEDGITTKVCTFAMCEAHCRLPVTDLLISVILSTVRSIREKGPLWLLTVASIAAASALYTPVIRTALMIVSCHPFYQCEFENCWSWIDQKFALAAFLSLTVIILFGVGLPVGLFAILYRRKAILEETFSCKEYGGRYTNSDGHMLPEEWSRFTRTDNTALAGQYRDLEYKWIYFAPMLVMLKVAALLPAILIEPRTIEQRLGCAVIEMGIALLMFSTKAYLSPLVAMSLRIGEVHQLLLLGLQNLDLVTRNDGNGDLADVMLVVTVLYIVYSVFVFFVVALFPVFDTIIRDRALTTRLHSHGLLRTNTIGLYHVPSLQPQVYSGGEDEQISEEISSKLAVRKQNITIKHTVDEEKECVLRVVPFTPAETSEGEQ